MSAKSDLEKELAFQITWAVPRLPQPETQIQIIPGRKLAWDFGWRAHRLLVEVQGGSFSKGKMGHNSGTGIHRDCEKLFLATQAGWRQINVADHHILRTGEALAWIRSLLEQSTIDAGHNGHRM
jgi:hypothetical protein